MGKLIPSIKITEICLQLYDSTINFGLTLNLTSRTKICTPSIAFSQLPTPSFLKHFTHLASHTPLPRCIPRCIPHIHGPRIYVSLPLSTAGPLRSGLSSNSAHASGMCTCSPSSHHLNAKDPAQTPLQTLH